jgi:NADH dehydrogenase
MSAAPPTCDVLVLGASFAGIEVLHQLRKIAAGRSLSVTVVDRQAQHPYIPLLHERLVDRLTEGESVLPTARWLGADPRARFVCGEIVGFDPAARAVRLASGELLVGRFVVVALGSTVSPPPGLRGGERALRCKFEEEHARLRAALEAALRAEGPQASIVVVGGGITGVEVAGELAHLRKKRPEGWQAPAVTLVHGRARLLEKMSPRAGRRSEDYLRGQGVALRLGARLLEIEEGAVTVRAGEATERLPASLVIWAGGLRPSAALAGLGLPQTAEGWLAVGPTLQCLEQGKVRWPAIFACGDAARVIGGEGEWPTMQRAIECLWQAKVVARNVARLASAPSGEDPASAPLLPHSLRRDFFHGISLGGRSLVVYGGLVIDAPRLNTWFRRFLMRRYLARYRPRSGV